MRIRFVAPVIARLALAALALGLLAGCGYIGQGIASVGNGIASAGNYIRR